VRAVRQTSILVLSSSLSILIVRVLLSIGVGRGLGNVGWCCAATWAQMFAGGLVCCCFEYTLDLYVRLGDGLALYLVGQAGVGLLEEG